MFVHLSLIPYPSLTGCNVLSDQWHLIHILRILPQSSFSVVFERSREWIRTACIMADGTCRSRKWGCWIVSFHFSLHGVVADSLQKYSILTTPTELIKIRQQQSPIKTSTSEVIRTILRTEGVRGLYRGFAVTALRDLGYGPYFLAVSYQS